MIAEAVTQKNPNSKKQKEKIFLKNHSFLNYENRVFFMIFQGTGIVKLRFILTHEMLATGQRVLEFPGI